MASGLPVAFEGTVVHGYGRGGKQLDCPTANLDETCVARLPSSLKNGVYWGGGRVKGGGAGEEKAEIPIVLSIGDNPHFGNDKRTLEVHFLQKMPDFYGATIGGTICGFIREMKAFGSMEELVEAIRKDKEDARRAFEDYVKK